MRTSLSRVVAAIALLTACTGDAVRTTAPPSPQAPTSDATVQPATRLVVLDSTQLLFAGTPEERAAGHYVFQVLGPVPALGPGDYVAGKQGGQFLGRVISLSRSGERLAVEMAKATWSDVFQPFNVTIPFTPGAGSAKTAYGEVRWGPWYLVRQPGQRAAAAAGPFRTAAGAPVDPIDFNPQNFFLNNFDLCASGGVVSICNISAKLINAQFSLTGGLNVSSDINLGQPPSVSVSVTANEQFSTALDVQLTGTGKIGVEVPVGPGFARDFTVGAVKGKLTVGIIVGAEASATGTIEPHVAVADTVTTGGNVSLGGGFGFQFSGAGHFDAGAKVVDLGDVGAKLSIGPKAEVKLEIGDGGFDLGAGADGFVEGTENLTGILGSENWHVHVDAGTEAFLAGSLKIPLIAIDIGGTKSFTGPGINLVDLWGTGDLKVLTSTTGKDVFPGQVYTTAVARATPTEPPPWSAVLSAALGPNDSHLFTGGLLCRQFFQGAPLIPPFVQAPQDCDLVATGHTVNLSGVAANCSAAEPLPAALQVKPRNPFDPTARITPLTLAVVCRSTYALVQDRVAALLASGAINRAGLATALRAQLARAEAQRDAGDSARARRAIFAFARRVHAQSGRHITTAAAAELLSLAALVSQCYVTRVPTCSAVPVTLLALTRAQIVLARIELATSRPCANARDERDCDDVAAGPALLGLPVDGTTAVPLDGAVPAGTYSQVRAKVDAVTPDEDDPAASAFLVAHPDLKGISVKLSGAFTDAQQRPHTFTLSSEVDAAIVAAFRPPVTVGPHTANLAIHVDAPGWFLDPTGVLLDPTIATNARLIVRNVRDSFKAREGDTDDSTDDHEEVAERD